MLYCKRFLPVFFLLIIVLLTLPQAVFAATITVDNGTSTSASDGSCSLPEAIANANNNNQIHTGAGECPAGSSALTDTITLGTDVTLTIVGSVWNGNNGLPVVQSAIILDGDNHIIERSNAISDTFRIIAIDQTGNVTLQNLTLRNGSAQNTDGGTTTDDDGGAIFSMGALNISDGIFTDNTAANRGGFLWHSSTTTIRDITISSNSAGSDGGGVYSSDANLIVANNVVTQNIASGWGGGFMVSERTVTISSSILSENVAVRGGAITTTNGGSLVMSDSEIIGNMATYGGGLYYADGYGIVRDTEISGNTATYGGGLAVRVDCSIRIVNIMLTDNDADYGGGIYADECSLNGANVLIQGNSSSNEGGGIYSTNYSGMYFQNSIISGNHANLAGGGVYKIDPFNDSRQLYFENGTITGNYSGSTGGGINSSGVVTLANSIVWGNLASTSDNQISGSVTATYSGIEDGWVGTGNITLASNENMFVSPIDANNAPTSTGDFHLLIDSPVVNMGDNSLVSADFYDADNDEDYSEILPIDIYGGARILGGIVDMGADEVEGIAEPELNLILNGDFTNGDDQWTFYNDIQQSVTNEQVNLSFASGGGTNGSMYQTAYYIAPVSFTFEVRLDIASADAVSKQVAIWMQPNDASQFVSCTFNLPASSDMTTYSMRFMTTSDWVTLRLSMKPLVDDDTGILVDNISVVHRPSLNVIDTECAEVVPENTNLIYNGGFDIGSDGEDGWTTDGTLVSTVTSGTMNLSFPATADGWLRQVSSTYPLQSDLPMVATIDVSNPDSITKTLQFLVRNGTLTNNYYCGFAIPANAGSQTYTMLFKPQINWDSIRVDVRPKFIGGSGLNIDNVSLVYDPSAMLTSNPECIGTYDPPPPPQNVNLIFNPSFSFGTNGDAGWRTTGSIVSNVADGRMHLSFPSVVDGWLRQYRGIHPLPSGAKMVAWISVRNPATEARNFQIMFRDSALTNTYFCEFTVPVSTQKLVYYMQFRTKTYWEVIRVDVRPNTAQNDGLNFDNVNLRYRPNADFTSSQPCISPAPDEAPTPPPETETLQYTATLQADNGGSCNTLDWTDTDNWVGYLPTSEVQYVFDPFPQNLPSVYGGTEGGLIYDANGDGVADTLYDAILYGFSAGKPLPTDAILIREAVIAMLNDRYDSNHPESWWAVEIDTAEALAQGENAMLALAQQYALSNASCG